MNSRNYVKAKRLIIIITVILMAFVGVGMYIGSRFISAQLLNANKSNVVDIAQVLKNNFTILDEEVAYMKSLTFNEMEVDPINYRLMNMINHVALTEKITNIYVIAPLAEDEIVYTIDENSTEAFGYAVGTKLNGIWLLNGIFDENGEFKSTQREDINRYTLLTEELEAGMEAKLPYGEYSEDSMWGNFVTGYAPLYTEEGSFVGLLGVDMSPDIYQSNAQQMIYSLFSILVSIGLVIVVLFLYFYFKFLKAKESELYFDFYSRMSHDMRTPMNGILGLARLSEDETDINVLHRYFSQVKTEGIYMLGLINDTLDVQKLDAGKLMLDPKVRKCRDVIDAIIALMKPEAEKKGVEFEFLNKGANLDCYAMIDEMRLQQIFINLISNAIKFTPQGGKVTVTMECLHADKELRYNKFSIQDTGIGMSEEYIQEHLFKPFSQEHNSTVIQYGGTGLGLSIVKSLVELMGGRIEVESEPGEGTVFYVFLNMEVLDDKKIEQEVRLLQKKDEHIMLETLNGKRILICEDNSLNAQIACRLLEKQGCIVTVAKNGKEGCQVFADSKVGEFAAVLMDIRMPELDGLSATRRIRSTGRADAATIPIIAMTANSYDEDIDNCLAAGMNAHLSKPIDPALLYKTIEEAILR